MPRASKVCGTPGCPAIGPDRYCPAHTRQRDRARGTRQERGYDAAYQRARNRWATQVERGGVACWRCGKPIPAAGPWHLGHSDHDRRIIKGPEHPLCNLSAAGKAAHGTTRTGAT